MGHWRRLQYVPTRCFVNVRLRLPQTTLLDHRTITVSFECGHRQQAHDGANDPIMAFASPSRLGTIVEECAGEHDADRDADQLSFASSMCPNAPNDVRPRLV